MSVVNKMIGCYYVQVKARLVVTLAYLYIYITSEKVYNISYWHKTIKPYILL